MRKLAGVLVTLLAVLTVASCNGSEQAHQGKLLFGPRRLIDAEISSPGDVLARDLDGDGDLDLLCVAASLTWYENRDGRGHFGGAQQILEEARLARTAAVADVDGDGDVDVATADIPAWRSGRLVWFANGHGGEQGRFGRGREISRHSVSPAWVLLDDLDDDGDPDAVAVIGPRDNTVAWFENRGGGMFSDSPRIVSKLRGIRAVAAADLDGDGASDLLIAASAGLRWYQNEVGGNIGSGRFGPPQVLTEGRSAFSLSPADLDGDGDLDVLAGDVGGPLALSGTHVAWYENLDGRGQFSAEPRVAVAASGGAWLSAADLDGDGDLDVLAAMRQSMGVGGVVWHPNRDGHLGPALPISTEPQRSDAAAAADLDGDGDLDVIAVFRPAPFQGVLAWYENQLTSLSKQGAGPRR